MNSRLLAFRTALLVALCNAAIPSYSLDIQDPAGQLLQARKASDEKQFQASIGHYEKAIAINATQSGVWDEYAQACYNAKEYTKAIVAFKKAYELGSGFLGSNEYQIGACYCLMGQKELGMAWVKKSFDAGFRSLGSIVRDPDFNSLHNLPQFKKLMGTVEGKLSRVEGWRHDLRFLTRELTRIHYSPYSRVSKTEFWRRVEQCSKDIPRLNDDQIKVRLMQFAQLMGDGHTELWSPYAGVGFAALPVRFYDFDDGTFITEAEPAYESLLGSRIVSIDGKPLAEVNKALDSVISRDNTSWTRFIAPRMLRCTNLLFGLGVTAKRDSLRLKINTASGEEKTVVMASRPEPENPKLSRIQSPFENDGPLSFRRQGEPYWFEHVPDRNAVYFAFNGVRNAEKESLLAFCDRLFADLKAQPVQRLVIDMRRNGGGSNRILKPLLNGLVEAERQGSFKTLVILIGRNTFSAAMNAAAQIERSCSPIFIGEPTGTRPNFVGESASIKLPWSGLQASVSDLFWQNASSDDYRQWIAPTVLSGPKFSEFSKGRDHALELAFDK